MYMDKDYLWLGKTLVSFLPSDWEKTVFSLFVRNCCVNNKTALSKEFQCKCLTGSCTHIIDLAKYYDNDNDVLDKMFEIMDFLFDIYKSNEDNNFLLFKLNKDGSYEIKKFSISDSSIDNKIIVNTVNKYLLDK